MLYYALRFIVQPLYLLIRRPKVYGRKNFKSISKGKAMIISNHRSMLDPPFIALVSNRFIHFMAKAELFKNKLAVWFFKAVLAFPVDRKHADMKSIKQALALMDKGCVFGIFPEGKRSVTDDVDAFEKGAAFLAVRAKVSILPVYIPANNYHIFKRPRLYVGSVITPEEYDFEGSKSAAVDKLKELMENRVNELRQQAGD